MPTDDDDGPLELFWDDLHVARQRPVPANDTVVDLTGGRELPAGTLVIGTSRHRRLVTFFPDGTMEYGPDYTPDEAAVVLLEAIGRRKLEMDDRLLLVGHMDAVLNQLGTADLRNQAADIALRERVTDETLLASRRAQAGLERAMHNAIELGRGMARRPDIPQPAVPERVPNSIRNNPNSSYGETTPPNEEEGP